MTRTIITSVSEARVHGAGVRGDDADDDDDAISSIQASLL